MQSVPRSALILGFAGVLPFLWGVGTLFSETMAIATMSTVGPRFVGPFVLLSYGTIILAFMSGVLWGFATKATGSVAALGYALSTVPALWAFFFVGNGPANAATSLIIGFLAVLILDYLFTMWRLTPEWWMSLRIPLTALVVGCLFIVVVV